MDPKNEEKLLTLLTQTLAENSKLMAQIAKQVNPSDADYEAQHRAVQAKLHPPGPEQIVYRNIQAASGAWWDFVISPQNGRVFDIVFLRLPAGGDKHVRHGGLVDDELQMFNKPREHKPMINADGLDESVISSEDQQEMTMQYRQHIRERYTLPDRLMYVGKPMPEHLKPRRADKAAE